ncbi:hypothetical protein, conserved [Babesia bigemina]|uniref:Uncharacterized protein n=1 Tax=Babesia bigemina TaxID=5866 RepID=A0A061D1S2_BABBI|nr:hypothetical protein, conserved [Babesia bigemina]CDR94082.1 hypothetical protein, conserved [Babesia bigemina]|eukprot:XP_012766268.1 hypothetical protein, conserved [Babesia bigemina]
MVDPTMNARQGSPMRCCNPRAFRRNASPVFRQQFISDNGKMKLSMPMSPLHYITASGYYANDLRLASPNVQMDAQKCPQPVPYPMVYDQQPMQMGSIGVVDACYPQRMESVGSRPPTPNMQVFVQQPQEYRRASAQLGGAQNVVVEQKSNVSLGQPSQRIELTDILLVLTRIEKKVDHLQELHEAMENENKEKNAMFKPKSGEQTAAQLHVHCTEHLVQQIKPASLEKLGSKLSVSSETLSKSSSGKYSSESLCDRPMKQLSMPSITQELANIQKPGSKVFDVSNELRKSNDMLEQFLATAGAIGDVDDQEGALQHENLQLSQAMKHIEAGQHPTQEICDQEGDDQSKSETIESYSAAKPIVSTVSMIMEDQAKDSIENLEKRFHMLIKTLEHNRGDNARMNGQTGALEGRKENAIEGAKQPALTAQQLQAIAAGGFDAEGGFNMGEIALRGIIGELATREAEARTGSELQTRNIQLPAVIPTENTALTLQSQQAVAPVVPQDMGFSLNEHMKSISTEHREELQQAEQALRTQVSNNSRSGTEEENLVAKSSNGEMDSQNLTCSMLTEDYSRQYSLEHADSIRDLNT